MESLIQQLAEEQKEIDQLTATVFEERMAIAKETDYVTSLAQVRKEKIEQLKYASIVKSIFDCSSTICCHWEAVAVSKIHRRVLRPNMH